MAADDDWDFYPCRIDDIPASIFLNLRYEHEPQPTTATTLYRLRLPMREPDEHGMGSAGEAAAMNAFDDELARRAEAGDLRFVARIRHRANWELVYYGPPDRSAALQAVREVFGERRTYIDVRPDPDWGFYREFLLPDAERKRWMHDRRLTDVLRQHGDALATPRRVDHWAHFATAGARDRFVTAAQQAGFALQRAAELKDGRGFGAQIHRVDPVELEHIHDVVMEVVELATTEGGTYDSWDTAVEPADSDADREL
jgi:hypothetical protein